MPSWLHTISRVLPLRYFNDAVSAALTGNGSLGDIGIGCAALVGFTVVFAAIGLKTFRWSNRA